MRKISLITFITFITLITFISLIGRFLQPPPGRTNFLILGLSGDQRAGANLTDTMIFLSVANRSGKTVLLSLPRDIWVAPLRTKLNSVYYYRGIEGIKMAVGEILGEPVDYSLVIDFAVFQNLIEAMGGVEVEVERTFDDYRYPIAGKENDPCGGDPAYHCRYEHIQFTAGKQWMDGETALKYVRSRNAQGEEGTDFAREKRQQQLIKAIKEKLSQPRFWLTPRRPLELIRAVRDNIWSDVPPGSYPLLVKIALRMRRAEFRLASLDQYLFNPPVSLTYDRQWVLVPKKGWLAVHDYLDSLLVN